MRLYVGLETNLRELAVPVPDGRGDITRRVDVHQSWVLANDLFHHRADMSGRWPGCPVEAA